MKHFYNVELNEKDAENLKAYLRENGIYFEPSSCYNLIHFEIKVDEAEADKVNKFLAEL